MRLQEDIGFKLVTDGEYNRTFWQRDFLLKFQNVQQVAAKLTVRFHSAAGSRDHSPPSLQVTGKLARPAGIFVDDFKFLKSVAHAPAEDHHSIADHDAFPRRPRSGRRQGLSATWKNSTPISPASIAKKSPTLPQRAAATCRSTRSISPICATPSCGAQVRNIGEDPDTLPKTYARLLNETIAGRPADMVVCMHLCRGNFAGAWVAEGGYEPVAELLFNEIAVDGYFLEYDSPRAGSFAPLRFLPKGKIAVLGLVTTKSAALETKDEIKRRIDEASRYAPLDQLALSPQCGFSSGIGGQAMTVERRDREARDW